MVESETRRITARAFLEALTEAGIIRNGDYVRRVVIDAVIGSAVVVHVERFGDARLLRVARTLEGLEIDDKGDPPDLGQHQ